MAGKSDPNSRELLQVFVYGTLKRGGQYHHLMQQCGGRYLGTGKLVIPYPLILADYPCLLDLPGKGYRVSGEVYSLESENSWNALDRLEGHPEEYQRRPERIETSSGILIAWTYFYIRNDLDEGLKPVMEFRV